MSKRYGIYYAPATASALWQRASQWIDRDATDRALEPATIPGVADARRRELTTLARRYGFHGTIKAPMALAGHQTVENLESELTTFTLSHRPVPMGRLQVTMIGDFLALMPIEQSAAVRDFANETMLAFEAFRAPLAPGDRSRRLEAGLTEQQIDYLDRYGYPYVLEHFLFHMTIGDRLLDADRNSVVRAAQDWFAPVLEAPVILDRLTLFVEPEAGAAFVRQGDYPLLSQASV